MPPSSIFSSVLRQKPERRKPLAAPLPNGRIISRNQVKLSTVSSTLRTAPLRFPFPRFSTSNLVSSFVSTLVSHLRFSLSLPLRLLYSPPLQMTPFFPTPDPGLEEIPRKDLREKEFRITTTIVGGPNKRIILDPELPVFSRSSSFGSSNSGRIVARDRIRGKSGTGRAFAEREDRIQVRIFSGDGSLLAVKMSR